MNQSLIAMASVVGTNGSGGNRSPSAAGAAVGAGVGGGVSGGGGGGGGNGAGQLAATASAAAPTRPSPLLPTQPVLRFINTLRHTRHVSAAASGDVVAAWHPKGKYIAFSGAARVVQLFDPSGQVVCRVVPPSPRCVHCGGRLCTHPLTHTHATPPLQPLHGTRVESQWHNTCFCTSR